MPPLLIDVSNHQGTIAWSRVKGGVATLNGQQAGTVAGALIKATEGVDFLDGYLAPNSAGTAANRLPRGFYHFMRADLGTHPADEADWFWQGVRGRLEVGDSLWLDVEDYPGRPQPADLHSWVSEFLARLRALAGFNPGIYSTTGYLAAHNLTNKPNLADYGLWLANWVETPPVAFPPPAPGWQVVALRQFTSQGAVPGIMGAVDLNYFNGTIEQFGLYGKPVAAAPPSRLPLDLLWYVKDLCRATYTDPGAEKYFRAIEGSVAGIKDIYGYQP